GCAQMYMKARIDGKAFAQSGRPQCTSQPPVRTHDGKRLPRGSARCGRVKCRMIWDSVLIAEPAEPVIGEVHLNFAIDEPLRADRKDTSHDQHPDPSVPNRSMADPWMNNELQVRCGARVPSWLAP